MSTQPPSRPWLGVASLVANRELLIELLKRQLTQEHRGTVAGKAWLVFKPLFLLALYVFVFGFIFEGKFGDEHQSESKATFALGVFLGLAIIHFASEILATAPRCIADNPRLIKRVKMPIETIPAAQTGAAAFHFLISLGLALLGLLIFGHPPTWHALWLLPLFVLLTLGGLGVAYLLATAGVYARDLSQITPALSMALLFASAVFYPVEQIPPGAWTFLQFNPLLLAIDAARDAALWGRQPELGGKAIYFCSLCFITYLLGYGVFQRHRQRFADYV